MGRRFALLFPGQAAQQVGMGRQAAARFSQASELFDRVDGVLGAPISTLCFEGPAERLQETRWQQPAIFACSLALYAAWQATEAGGSAEPLVAAGHSLGEYSALVAAGALELEDGARLVALRGRLMQEAADRTAGGMAVVLGLDGAQVASLCADASRPEAGDAETVVLANDNSPEQQVISGGSAALERAVALAKAAGARRVLPLKVAGAFHSPLMRSAVEELRTAILQVPLRRCAFPVIANSTSAALWEPDEIRAELIRQVTAPVRWVESLQFMATFVPEAWVDTGPGAVMAGLASRTLPSPHLITLASEVDTAVQE